MSAPRTKRSKRARSAHQDSSPQSTTEQLEIENERLRRQLKHRDEQLAEAKKQIADLERQPALRHQNATTSSKPPSSDGLAGRQRERGRRKKSRRRPGDQPGHPGHCRPLVPSERVNAVIDVFPDACRHCHHAFPTRGRRVSGEPRRHQVTELPSIEVHVTEYHCPHVVCPSCGKTTLAPLPEVVAGQFGPQLTALMAYLTVVCRLPRRLVQALLEDALHVPISLGSTQAASEEASDAVTAPCEALEAALAQQPVLNGDDTGHRTNGEKRWLWAIVAPTFVVYRIATTHAADVLVALLGEVFAGVLCGDRWRPYQTYHRGQLQFCRAHFKRNVLGALDLAKTTDAERFCRDALALHARLFRLWYRFRGDPTARGGSLTRAQLIDKVIPLQKTFFALGERHLDSANNDVRNVATALFVHHEQFFVFVHHEGVEPTNNRAERALRAAVQWRKIMFGNRREEGEVAVARLLTVTRTCQMQQLNALAYLTAARFALTVVVKPSRHSCQNARDRLNCYNVDFTLPVEGVAQEVTVAVRAGLLQTATAEISDIVESRRVVQTPLNGRNVLALAQLSDAVVMPPDGTRGEALQQAGPLPNVGGQRSGHNVYLLDGTKVTDELFNNLVISPSVDSIEELKIQKSMYPAELGGKGSALINVITKAGANSIRGSGFWFGRHDRFDARNYFDRRDQPKPRLRQHQFSGAAGGPIRRDRTALTGSKSGAISSTS